KARGTNCSGALNLLLFRAESRNGAIGTSDMDGEAAREAASESGDERVQSLNICHQNIERCLDFARHDRRRNYAARRTAKGEEELERRSPWRACGSAFD